MRYSDTQQNAGWFGYKEVEYTECRLAVEMAMEVSSPQGWDLVFKMAINDWEIDRVAGLLHTLNAFPGVTKGPDTPIWKMHKKGIFFYEVLLLELKL
ncbi:hypothetical protein H5410_031347 [Solanum commersonii]|uniref:Uncharacterized protein n=1 Tax=Solanum commersonii TaxID=4109 RepID=A0A9J5YI56_SOLCO|nr:hypothetical protein H5410_031347 [Solanum commersonii]